LFSGFKSHIRLETWEKRKMREKLWKFTCTVGDIPCKFHLSLCTCHNDIPVPATPKSEHLESRSHSTMSVISCFKQSKSSIFTLSTTISFHPTGKKSGDWGDQVLNILFQVNASEKLILSFTNNLWVEKRWCVKLRLLYYLQFLVKFKFRHVQRLYVKSLNEVQDTVDWKIQIFGNPNLQTLFYYSYLWDV
jgi:hypothetical protein